MKKITFILCTLLLFLVLPLGVLAESGTPRLVDGADVLEAQEEAALLARLNAVSEEQMVDVVVYTVSDIGDASAEDFADNLFETCGYGMDAQRSCILLLVSTETRDWHITTAGYGITAVTDVGVDYLSEQFLPHLSAGNYADAFGAYAECCDDFLARARTGNPFDADDLPKKPFPIVRNFMISLLIGVIAAWIAVGKQKAKLVSVRPAKAAGGYMKAESLVISESKDFFLYKTVDRTEKAERSEDSSTHQTSAGTTVGGGGGKF